MKSFRRYTSLFLKLALILLLSTGVSSCAQILAELDKQAALDEPTEPPKPAKPVNLDEAGAWTILIYLDADNNLEGAGVDDLNEILTMAPNLGNNKVYVLMDRIGGYSTSALCGSCQTGGTALESGFNGGYLFEVDSSANLTLIDATTAFSESNWTTNNGSEPNMGSRELLQDFVKWGLNQTETNGTKYTFLDIWDHGAGWGGALYGGNAVAWDDTDGHDALSMKEIRTALTNAQNATDKQVTIVGYDACYMGTLENVFNLEGLAQIMIGSEELEPGDGWDYEKWVPQGDKSPNQVASDVVTTFQAFYDQTSGTNVTLSATNLNHIPALQASIDSFVNGLASASGQLISSARLQSQTYNQNTAVDLYDFADRMNMAESTTLKNAIKSAMVAESHTDGGSVSNSNGLSIFFPSSPSAYDSAYDNTQIASKTRWDEFISGKVNSFEVSTDEPNDVTCPKEDNNTGNNAGSFAGGSCQGYIYSPTDVDIYKFDITGIDNAADTITIKLTDIPSGANFDVFFFVPSVSPSNAVASGALGQGNGSEGFTYTLQSGNVSFDNYTTDCDPTDGTNILYQYGYCYGQGTSSAEIKPAYVIVAGNQSSYSQTGKYTLSVTGSGITIAAP